MQRQFPFPIPNGWFQVAYSDELAPRELRGLHYFDSELVLYRGEDGRARVLDAYCPHLGAHLGCGGEVRGNRIRCPFHAWEFDSDGKCVAIPYAEKIPPKASIRSWPVDEKNGMIMVHHHKQEKPPSFEVPVVPEYASPEWTDYYRRDWIIRSRNQEMAENSVDPAHFMYVHRTQELPRAEAEFEDHLMKVKLKYPIVVGDKRLEGNKTSAGPAGYRFDGDRSSPVRAVDITHPGRVWLHEGLSPEDRAAAGCAAAAILLEPTPPAEP